MASEIFVAQVVDDLEPVIVGVVALASYHVGWRWRKLPRVRSTLCHLRILRQTAKVSVYTL